MDTKEIITLIGVITTFIGVVTAIFVFRHNMMHNRRQIKIAKLEEILETISKLIVLYEPLRNGYEVVQAQYNEDDLLAQLLASASQAVVNERANIISLAGSKEILYNQLSRLEILNDGYINSKSVKVKVATILELFSVFSLTIFGELRNGNDRDLLVPNHDEFLHFIQGLKNNILAEMKLNAELVTPTEIKKYKEKRFQKDFALPPLKK